MSFQLPSVKVKPTISESIPVREGHYGVPDLMTEGFIDAQSNIAVSHPIFLSEQNYVKNQNNMNIAMLRNTQGLHAPLRITMELKAAQKIGRLPFLTSSNIMYDVLTGRDMEIGPQDIFNTPEFSERGGQPHAVMERSLGLL